LKNDSSKVNVYNRQRKLPLDTGDLWEFLCLAVERLAVEEGFSVILIGDRAMTKLHARFAGKNRTTDVLSFPIEPESRRLLDYLGDIFVSVETANRRRKGSIEEELRILSLHGLLHLLGYDHEKDDGEMTRLEVTLRREFGLDEA
jgi:probable rRNA maturation factor